MKWISLGCMLCLLQLANAVCECGDGKLSLYPRYRQCRVGKPEIIVMYLINYRSLQVNNHLLLHLFDLILLAHSMQLMAVPVALVARVC